MFKKLMLFFIALLFPFIALFIKDQPGSALIALLLQATFFGWPIASIWAIKVIFETPKEKKNAPS
jgi:uncharacterized membrane protein YqaE (UPF0057 family)